MILRRFMQHVKEQNWFAVGLDVIVVIVGIFLGLQVQEWNEDRTLDIEEKQALLTLDREVSQKLETKAADIKQINRDYNYIISSLEIIFDKVAPPSLSAPQCRSVWASHTIDWEYSPLVSLNELIASGKLTLIKSDALRLKLTDYSAKIEDWAIYARTLRAEANVLVDDYSEILVRRWMDSQDTVSCHVDRMRLNQGFLNALQSNRGRTNGLVIMLQHEIDLLNEIKQLIALQK